VSIFSVRDCLVKLNCLNSEWCFHLVNSHVFVSRGDSVSLSRLAELHALVGAQEAHKLRHLDDLDVAGEVNIKVAPGLVEVGVEVLLESGAGQALVGVEDLLGGGVGSGLVHPEFSTGLAVDLVAISILITVSSLESVLLNHGAHEDVVGIGGEARSGSARVADITNIRVLVEEGVPLTELDVRVVTRNVILRLDIPDISPGGRLIGLLLGLGLSLIVGVAGLVSSEAADHVLIIIMPVDRSKLPDLMGVFFSLDEKAAFGSHHELVLGLFIRDLDERVISLRLVIAANIAALLSFSLGLRVGSRN